MPTAVETRGIVSEPIDVSARSRGLKLSGVSSAIKEIVRGREGLKLDRVDEHDCEHCVSGGPARRIEASKWGAVIEVIDPDLGCAHLNNSDVSSLTVVATFISEQPDTTAIGVVVDQLITLLGASLQQPQRTTRPLPGRRKRRRTYRKSA